jgi:hypothetical protein
VKDSPIGDLDQVQILSARINMLNKALESLQTAMAHVIGAMEEQHVPYEETAKCKAEDVDAAIKALNESRQLTIQDLQ